MCHHCDLSEEHSKCMVSHGHLTIAVGVRVGEGKKTVCLHWSGAEGRMVDQHQSPVIACKMSYDVRM